MSCFRCSCLIRRCGHSNVYCKQLHVLRSHVLALGSRALPADCKEILLELQHVPYKTKHSAQLCVLVVVK